MVHRILGWLFGYVKVRMNGQHLERFVNLCRNHNILLWQLYWDKEKKNLYFRIALHDFYRLRPLARKCRVRVLIVKRYGLPFILGRMKRHISFCMGVFFSFLLVIFLSSRIWGISVEGQSYHTKESILEYLESVQIYGGMPAKELHCSRLEEKIRKKYQDIGWVSVERKGSKIYIRIKEVVLVEKEKKEKKGHLIAENNGRVVSIVTRKGTARVRAGKKVKKGDILISGVVRIYGDNQELKEKDFVHAEGIVVLENSVDYKQKLKKTYSKKKYTGRERKIYEWQIGKKKFFSYNPLKNLETYEKYDIIREGGQLYPFVSLRFPIATYVKTFRETEYKKAQYSKEEASEILEAKYDDYLTEQKQAGYVVKKQKAELQEHEDCYLLQGQIVFWKEQKTYREIPKKKIIYKDYNANGNNGNGN
ncbi:MAG: sporulation protein YqfD [Butyribacter sp.]|nr:sporulation protein YqfD [bacterium]MDY3853440.1 sporulation protein YqfD [Butyribacter sp.]